MKKLFPFILTVLAASSYAQKITIQWVEVSSNRVIVHFDLEDSNPNNAYSISLFSSKDNFAAPLSKVTGDLNDVKAGLDKKVEWDIVAELGNYKGDIEMELRGRVYVPFVKINFDGAKTLKAGKSYPLVWTSGNMSGTVDIEIFDGQTRVHSDRNVPNTGKYELTIPGSVKRGGDYKIKFTNTKARDEVVFTPAFSIKPKTSKLLIIGPILAVGGVVAAVIGGGGGGGNGGGTGSSELPDHPNVPN